MLLATSETKEEDNVSTDCSLIFNCQTAEQIFNLLGPYLAKSQPNVRNRLKDKLTANRINGESLMFIDQSQLHAMNIYEAEQQNIIINAINKIYDHHTFAKYIETFLDFQEYAPLFVKNKIDLITMKRRGHSMQFYIEMGIKSPYKFKVAFSRLFSVTVRCCNVSPSWRCNTITFDSKSQFDKKINNKKQSINCWTANKWGLMIKDKDSFFRLIYGEYARVFCDYCSQLTQSQMKTCKSDGCNNQEWYRCLFGRYTNSEGICGNHPPCFMCDIKDITKPCKGCNEAYYCYICVLEQNWYQECQCKVCGFKKELNELTNTIFTALESLGFTKHIAQIIANYGIGFAVKCCNMNVCNKEVIIESQIALLQKKDYKNYTIYYYEPQFASSQRPTILINGKKMRIFCSMCTSNRIRSCNHCITADTVGCGMHPYCHKCGNIIFSTRADKCSQCNQFYCGNCCVSIRDSIYCEMCVANSEHDKLFEPVSNGLEQLNIGLDKHIIQIIFDFSVGLAVECGNKDDECNNDVAMDNMLQFKQKRDYKGDTIYYYEPQYAKKNKPTLVVDGKQIRIFCGDCTKSKLVYCEFCRRNRESGDKICGNHQRCSNERCLKIQNYGTWGCTRCNEPYCYPKCCVKINQLYCRKCAIKKEFDDLMEIICDATKDSLFDEQNKIQTILTSYCVGFIFKCCNEYDECKNNIAIDNIWQLKKKKNYQNKTIYYYSPRYCTEKRRTITYNNKPWRIFCNDCTLNKITKCVKLKCQKKECGNNECGMHSLCPKCGTRVSNKDLANKCNKCRKQFCNQHISYNQCENCWIRDEYRIKRSAVQIALNRLEFYQPDIIKLIAEYSIGYAIICQSTDKCYNEIIIDNEFHFDRKTGGISFYNDYNNNPKSIEIYGVKGYVVCSTCTKTGKQYY